MATKGGDPSHVGRVHHQPDAATTEKKKTARRGGRGEGIADLASRSLSPSTRHNDAEGGEGKKERKREKEKKKDVEDGNGLPTAWLNKLSFPIAAFTIIQNGREENGGKGEMAANRHLYFRSSTIALGKVKGPGEKKKGNSFTLPT